MFVGAGIGAAWAAAQRIKSSQEAAQENPPAPPKEMHPVSDEKMPGKTGEKSQRNGAGE
jgi:hypothetical protein